jgi:FHS family L-fucose permease-like MFS transporter
MVSKTNIRAAIPITMCFFVMGVVDFVGIATNYVKKDFGLTDTMANTLPMMVFIWFALLSIPSGMLMNKIGRKNTVALSLMFTFIGLFLPMISYTFLTVLIAFSLIGIGNAILQTSLNPLVTNVISPNRLTSMLTFGQFVKAIASFLGPVLAGFMAKQFGDWKLAFIVFSGVTVLSGIWLVMTNVPREDIAEKSMSFTKVLSLLKDKYIFSLFLGILFIVGIDVGLNISIPKLLMSQTNILLEDAGMGTTYYFVARTIGAFAGSILLARLASNRFLLCNMIIAIIALAVLLLVNNTTTMFIAIVVLGFTCSNVFSIIFSYALSYKKESANEMSSLMIMGVAGGALIMPIMGIVADLNGQVASLSLLFICILYITYLSLRLEKK